MPVVRNNDGSITIKSNKGVTAIGRITETSDDSYEEKFKQWVEDCAELVTACDYTLQETEDFFLKQCDALPLIKEDINKRNPRFLGYITTLRDMGNLPSIIEEK